jgi:hypothetical protein
MGCCFSKSDNSKPNEQTPLISDDTANQNGRLPYSRQEPMNAFKEQETLQKIVDQTAANLISIGPIETSDHLPQQDKIDRLSKYKIVLGELQVDGSRSRTSLNLAGKKEGSAVVEDIKGAKGQSNESAKWLYDAMDDINAAIHKIEIQSVGDIVVPLTFTT